MKLLSTEKLADLCWRSSPIIILIVIIVFIVYFNSYSREGFASCEPRGNNSRPWSKQLIQQFIEFQKIRNPNVAFDIEIIQTQATEREVLYLLSSGVWPWSIEIQQLYNEAVLRDLKVQSNSHNAMNIARTIYNEFAIKQLLGWKAPEGQFITNGLYVEGTGPGDVVSESSGFGDYGVNSGLISPNVDLIRCKASLTGMERVSWSGYDGITNARKTKSVDLKNEEIPDAVQGFEFLRGVCNPCVALKNPPEYACPFTLNGDDAGEKGKYNLPIIRSIWQNLWGLKGMGLSETNKQKRLRNYTMGFRIT